MSPLPLALQLLLPLGLGALLARLLAPRLCQVAWRYGVVDAPDGALKTQARAVPYLGGLVIYLAFILTLSALGPLAPQLLGLLLGGTVLVMLGLFDDMRAMTPGLKLAGQLLAAWVSVRAGIDIQLTFLPEPLAMLLSVLWLVGITNAINLIDVADGLATSVAAVTALALGVLAVGMGHAVMATAALALAGALLGFLPSNWAPARMYLGDAGSLFVGYMLAALSLMGRYTEHSLWGALAPICLLWLPLLEVALLIGARWRRGLSPFAGSPDHFALRLRARGWSPAKVAHLAWILALAGALVALWLSQQAAAAAAAGVAAAAVAAAATLIAFARLPAPRRPATAAAAAADSVSNLVARSGPNAPAARAAMSHR